MTRLAYVAAAVVLALVPSATGVALAAPGQAPAGQTAADQAPADQAPADQAPAGRAPAAVAVAADAPAADELPLDLPLLNADGELAGGVHPALPDDLAVLREMVHRARAEGIEPRRYAALLYQYWLVTAVDEAGIELAAWDPAAGLAGNEETLFAAYDFYGRLFLEHPEFEWAGLANMISPTFAAAFYDLQALGDVGELLTGRLLTLPPEVVGALPPEVRALSAHRGPLPDADVRFAERTFLAMQKHIFMDQTAMHMAYLGGGPDALEEMRAAGLIDDAAVGAWRDVASGDAARISRGNLRLLDREQNQIIPEQWRRLHDWNPPLGAVLTYGMTVAADPSVPGTRTPGQFSPLTVTGPLTGVRLVTPLPDFNLADAERRWEYIAQDGFPAFLRLLRDDPRRARSIVATPVAERVPAERLAARWPRLALDLTTGWRLELPLATAPPAPAPRP